MDSCKKKGTAEKERAEGIGAIFTDGFFHFTDMLVVIT